MEKTKGDHSLESGYRQRHVREALATSLWRLSLVPVIATDRMHVFQSEASDMYHAVRTVYLVPHWQNLMLHVLSKPVPRAVPKLGVWHHRVPLVHRYPHRR